MIEKWVIILIVFALFPSLLVTGCVNDPIVGRWENRSITPNIQLEFTSDNNVLGLETLPMGIDKKSIDEAIWSMADSGKYFISLKSTNCICEGRAIPPGATESYPASSGYAGQCISTHPSSEMYCQEQNNEVIWSVNYKTNPEMLTLTIPPYTTGIDLVRIS